MDLKVRNVESIDEYKNKIKNTCSNIDSVMFTKLLYSTNKINKILEKYNIIGFNGNKAANIKWKIGLINDSIYENGLPHTRNDVIIITKQVLNSYRLETTLIHEKIHVYQKLYPDDIKEYLNTNNFKISRPKTNNVRANPDIDEFIYKDSNGNEMYCEYNENPKSIFDVIYYPNNSVSNEHPLEYMAYNIESELNKFL